MALHQQVTEKLKTLNIKLKRARPQQYDEEQSFGRQHQQPTTSASRLQNALIVTNPKNIENEKINRDKPSRIVGSTKPISKSNRQENEKKSQQLEAELRALHKLVDQLSLENPELRPRIATIAKGMPALKQTDIVKLTHRLEAGQDNAFNQGASTSKNNSETSVRQHKRSLGSSEEPKSKSNHSISEENEITDIRTRKRGKRSDRKRKNSNKQKCHVNELRDLDKYINHIVEEHLMKNETSLGAGVRNQLKEFQGDFNELEAYATHLVELGLGRIVEDELRVNRKNNRQSFIEMSTDGKFRRYCRSCFSIIYPTF